MMQHNTERTIMMSGSIFVLMEFQPEGEGRQQQDEGEGKPPAQPLIRGRCGHVQLLMPPITKLHQHYIGIPIPSNVSEGNRPMEKSPEE